MSTMRTTADPERIGLDAGHAVGGPGAVERVRVEPTLDSLDRPTYHFACLVNPDHLPMGAGLFRARLEMRIRDELEARGDDHQIRMEFLDLSSWERRHRG